MLWNYFLKWDIHGKNRRDHTDEEYRKKTDSIKRAYDEAYYIWLLCPESEENEAKRILDECRHKWLNH